MTGDTDPLIRLDSVEKRFASGTVAIADLSLAVAAGEFVTLLGPSGCGKSTALRMIAGLLSPSRGAIAIGGRAAAQAGRQGDMSVVFQEATLMPWATVQENVYLPLRLAGTARAAAAPRIAEALGKVGLDGFEGAYPRQLSGGMKMRVSIARALVTRPRLLLMDEPFAALDEISRHRLNDDVLRVWQDEGLTVVFVTHSVAEAVFLSSRIVVMAPRPGRVVADLPMPRWGERGEAFRTSDEFAATARGVSAALHQTMTPAAP